MGTGAFDGGTFDFVIVADHTLDIQTTALWQARFILASRALFDATQGQLQFGTIHMCDDSLGLGAAEFILHAGDGRAFATVGGFGVPGQAVHLFGNSEEGTILHEFSHHAFSLYDEYTAPVLIDDIDEGAPVPAAYNPTPPGVPRFNEVPLVESEHPSQQLEFASAIIRFGNQLRTAFVETHTPTFLTVFGDYGQNPMVPPSRGFVFYQRTDGIRCATTAGPNFSVMENANPDQVTEFCTASNHNLDRLEDPERENYHSGVYGGLSCWEVIRDTMLERHGFALEVPEAEAAAGPTTTGFPVFSDLAKEARFVLVMDRSGSMAEDGKIIGARYGVEVWLEAMAQLGDYLSVVWYDEEIDVRLPLQEVTNVADLQELIEQTNNAAPRGWTNIRDALYEAHSQITSRPDRAAIQGVVLLTDGIHNRPEGSSALEVIPTFQADGIPILGIALGDVDSVDFETIEELCRQTGGSAQAVAAFPGFDPADDSTIRGATGVLVGMAHALLRNGVAIFGDLEISGENGVAAVARESIEPARKLQRLAKAMGLSNESGFRKRRRFAGAHSLKFHVEDGAEYAVFTIVYQEKQDVELLLLDPTGAAVAFDGSERVLIDAQAPLKIAIVRNPQPGTWHAVIARRSDGPAFKAFYYAQVENRRIAVHGSVSRVVPMEQSAVIRAAAAWKDRLSDLNVTARIRDPIGGMHHVVLSDRQHAEPNSGDYVGTFQPTLPGRHSVELCIQNKGSATLAGGIHRIMHGPEPAKDEGASLDLSTGAPVFARRVPLYFDAGKRPLPKDIDDRFGRVRRFPVKPRTKPSKPSDLGRALKIVEERKAGKAKQKAD